MSANYLNEAFTQLQLLNEEEFNLTDKDSIEDIKSLVDAPVDASIDIIDPDANNEDELSDSYVGKVVLDCSVCHSKIYKDPSEIVIDEVEELANVGEECPYCYTADGFKVLGQIAPFSDDVQPTEDEVSEEEADDVVEDDTDDDEDDDFLEALSEKLSQMNEAEMSDEDKRDNQILRTIYNKMQRRSNVDLTSDEQAVLDKYGLVLSRAKRDIVFPARTKYASKDPSVTTPPGRYDYGQDVKNNKVNLADRARKLPQRHQLRDFIQQKSYDVNDTTAKHVPENQRRRPASFQQNMNSANNAVMQRPVFDMKRALKDREQKSEILRKAELEYPNAIASAKSEYERSLQQAQDRLTSSQQDVADVNKEINKLLKKESIDFLEALSEKMSQMNEAEMSAEDKRDNQILRNIYDKTQRRANAALTPEEQAVLDKYGLYRSTGNKDIMKPGKDAFHARSITSPPRYFKGGVDVHDDRVNLADRARKISDRQPIRDFVNSGDYNFYDTTYNHDPKGNYKNTFQRKMNRAHSAQMQQPMQDMKRLISTRNYEQGRLDKADANYKDAIAKAKSDYEKRMKSAEDSLASTKKYASKSVNDANAEIDRMLKRGKKEDMEESLEKVEVSTEDSNTVITNDPVTNTVSVTTTTNDDGEGILVPLSDENAEEIAASTEENAEVPEEDNFIADDFDEESFDELGEAYLKKVYENIDAFKTTNVSSCGKKLAVEGLITFKSGNTKSTHFIFEQKAQNKKGTYRFIGENKQISRGKKSFILQGNVNDNKFICESLNYNYLGKNDGDKKSVRLYGTIKRGMNNG